MSTAAQVPECCPGCKHRVKPESMERTKQAKAFHFSGFRGVLQQTQTHVHFREIIGGTMLHDFDILTQFVGPIKNVKGALVTSQGADSQTHFLESSRGKEVCFLVLCLFVFCFLISN